MAQKETPRPTGVSPPQPASPTKAPSVSKEIRDVIISSLYQKKLLLESGNREQLSFSRFRDRLICIFVTVMTIMTAALFVSSPAELFPKWYVIAVCVMILTRIVDYSQKKEHFFLIDFCVTAGIQILFFLIFRPQSVSLATRSFAYGTGILGWSTILLSNGLTIHRLDEFCSLWIHTVPSLMAYTLRWSNESSVIYYKTAPFTFNAEHMMQYYFGCYIPYLLWVVGYYFLINKVFKNLTVEGDYMTLVKLIVQSKPTLKKLLDVFGSKYRSEAFMMYHAIWFAVVTSIGYACFFCQTLHIISLGLCVSFAIVNGAKALVNDLVKPYEQSMERINRLLATLG